MEIGSSIIRTGLFRYVRLQDVDTFYRYGWMWVADLGIPHNQWSVLMWHCECGFIEPVCPEISELRESSRTTQADTSRHSRQK